MHTCIHVFIHIIFNYSCTQQYISWNIHNISLKKAIFECSTRRGWWPCDLSLAGPHDVGTILPTKCIGLFFASPMASGRRSLDFCGRFVYFQTESFLSPKMNHGSRIMQKESKREHYSNTYRYPRWIPSTLNRLPIKSNSTGIWMTRKHTLNPTPESCQFARQKFLGVDSLEAAKPLDVECNVWFLWYWEPLLFICCFKQYFEFRFVGWCMLAIRLDLVYLSLSIYKYIQTFGVWRLSFCLTWTDFRFCKGTIHIPSIWHHPNNRNFATLMHLYRCSWSKLRWKVKPMIGPFHCNGQQIFFLLFSEKLMQIQIWFGVFGLYDLFLGISFWLGSFLLLWLKSEKWY